jgi:hypothetical protein
MVNKIIFSIKMMTNDVNNDIINEFILRRQNDWIIWAMGSYYDVILSMGSYYDDISAMESYELIIWAIESYDDVIYGHIMWTQGHIPRGLDENGEGDLLQSNCEHNQ